MSDSDATPPNGWNQLHPLHPSNLGRVEANVAQMFDGLVMQYGTLIAHRIWKEAAARYPRAKAKGRPKGSRTRDHWFDPRDANRTLHAIANDPGNAGLSRWQVFNRAAAVLDAGHQQEQRAKAEAKRRPLQALAVAGCKPQRPISPAPTFEQWVAALPKPTAKEIKARQRRISTIRRTLERLQADIDTKRTVALRTYDEIEAATQDDEIPSPRAKAQLSQWRSNALAAWPPLPQEGGSARVNAKKRAVEKSS